MPAIAHQKANIWCCLYFLLPLYATSQTVHLDCMKAWFLNGKMNEGSRLMNILESEMGRDDPFRK